ARRRLEGARQSPRPGPTARGRAVGRALPRVRPVAADAEASRGVSPLANGSRARRAESGGRPARRQSSRCGRSVPPVGCGLHPLPRPLPRRAAGRLTRSLRGVRWMTPPDLPETPADALGPTVRQEVTVAGRTFVLLRPDAVDRLIDHPA